MKSKKYVIYFYEAGNGGTVCSTDSRGKMTKGNDQLFGSKAQAMEIFKTLVDKHLEEK